jgi:integrase
VHRIKPKSRAFLLWDSKQPGLAVRVQVGGHKSWTVIYRHHGRPRWYHIGDVRKVPLKNARLIALRTMLEVAEGKDPAAELRAKRGEGTFEELTTKYLEEHAKKKNRSWKQADALVRRHLLPKWGKLRATDISRGDVRTLIGCIKAPIVANQTLAAASAIFSWAIRQEVSGVLVNPCTKIDRHATVSRDRVLSDGEVPLFWAALEDVDPIRAAALRIILLSGQRPGEIAHMRSEHVAEGAWTLPGAPDPALGWPGTKNGATHSVWLPKPVVAILEDVGEKGFMFGKALSGLDKVMRETCDKLKIPRATPHDLRRTHGSTITGLGFGRDAMNRIQNHREGGIADIYDRHRYAEENKRIMETVAARIKGLVHGTVGGGSNVIEFRPA